MGCNSGVEKRKCRWKAQKDLEVQQTWANKATMVAREKKERLAREERERLAEQLAYEEKKAAGLIYDTPEFWKKQALKAKIKENNDRKSKLEEADNNFRVEFLKMCSEKKTKRPGCEYCFNPQCESLFSSDTRLPSNLRNHKYFLKYFCRQYMDEMKIEKTIKKNIGNGTMRTRANQSLNIHLDRVMLLDPRNVEPVSCQLEESMEFTLDEQLSEQMTSKPKRSRTSTISLRRPRVAGA